MQEYPVAAEVADAEFYRFIDFNEIDADESAMTAEELKEFSSLKRTVVLAIMKGSLVLDENGIFSFTPRRSADRTPLVFHEPRGSAYIAMDKKKKTEDVGKMFATMGDICRVEPKTFALMMGADVKVCLAITTLFLA